MQWGWGAWDTEAAPPECKGAFGPKSSGTVQGGGKAEGRGGGEEGGSGQQGVGSAKEEQDQGAEGRRTAGREQCCRRVFPPRPLRHLLRRRRQRVVFL